MPCIQPCLPITSVKEKHRGIMGYTVNVVSSACLTIRQKARLRAINNETPVGPIHHHQPTVKLSYTIRVL